MSGHDDSTWGGGPDPAGAHDPLADLAAAQAESAGQTTWQARGPAMDPAGRIDADLPCRGCGYNLRGQSPHNTCPECGSPVEWSARGDRLQFYDPAWLGSLRRGMLWLIIAVFAGIALQMVGGVIAAAFQPLTPAYGPGGSGPTSFSQALQAQQGGQAGILIGIVFGLVASVLYLVGVWQLTEPMPGAPPDAPQTARACFRWGWIASAALGMAGNVAMLANVFVGMALTVVSLLPFCFAFFGMFIYLRGLALRIPNRSLASQTRTVMWGLVATTLLFPLVLLLLGAGVAATGGAGSAGGGAAVGVLGCGGMCLGLVALAVFGIWWLVLLFLYHGGFARAERQARATRRQYPQPAPY